MKHKTQILGWTLILLLLAAAPAWADLTTGWLDSGFDPGAGANELVRAVAVRPDGRILTGGRFTQVDGSARKGLALLKADGALDTTYVPQLPDGSDVSALAVQFDNQALVAGTYFDGGVVPFLTRLDIFGGVDSAFDPGAGPNQPIQAIALQPDGKVLIGGGFTTYDGTAITRIARLNADGSLDTTFDPGDGPNVSVEAIALQPDGKVLIGGMFTTVDGVSKNHIARLNADGSLDTGFHGSLGDTVRALALQDDGKIIVGGDFADGVRRLLTNGSQDSGFDAGPDPNGDVKAVAIQPDGRLIVGGEFTTLGGVGRQHLARLDAGGTVETGYLPSPAFGVNGSVYALALQRDGKLLLGGLFSTVNGVAHSNISRLQPDGLVDGGLDSGSGVSGSGFVTVFDVVAAPDGKLLIGGSFTGYDGITRLRVARLLSNGGLDADFGNTTNGPANGSVLAIAIQDDGQVIIGGTFTQVGTTARNRIARLDDAGALDATFYPPAGFDATVQVLVLQPDGKVLVGGAFSQAGGQNRAGIARLNTDGSLDTGFDPGAGANDRVRAVALLPNGRILIAGSFTQVDNTARHYIARLNADGSLDDTFDPAEWPDASLTALALQADGKIVIAGSFTHVGSAARPGFARLNADGSLDTGFDPGGGPNHQVRDILVQEDGNLLIGGDFTFYDGQQSQRIARIRASGREGFQDGSLDPNFDSAVGPNAAVRSVVLQPGAMVVIGGDFSTYRTAPAKNVARLNGGVVPGTDNVYAPDGQVGEPYSFQFTAHGLPRPTWAVAPGALPPGLSLDETSGLLEGRPTAAGDYTFDVWACNYLTGCGNGGGVSITIAPQRVFLPLVVR